MQLLRLDWPKCRDGYEILELRRSAVDWPPPVSRAGDILEYQDSSVPLPADATEAERRLLAKWGVQLSPDESVPKEWEALARVIEPRSNRMHVANVLATAPDLFVAFANINDSIDRLLAFF